MFPAIIFFFFFQIVRGYRHTPLARHLFPAHRESSQSGGGWVASSSGWLEGVSAATGGRASCWEAAGGGNKRAQLWRQGIATYTGRRGWGGRCQKLSTLTRLIDLQQKPGTRLDKATLAWMPPLLWRGNWKKRPGEMSCREWVLLLFSKAGAFWTEALSSCLPACLPSRT